MKRIVAMAFLASSACVAPEELEVVDQSLNGAGVREATRHPWVALLSDGERHFCTGTLVSSTDIVTTGHCVRGRTRVGIVLPYAERRFRDTPRLRWASRWDLYHGEPERDLAVIHLDPPDAVVLPDGYPAFHEPPALAVDRTLTLLGSTIRGARNGLKAFYKNAAITSVTEDDGDDPAMYMISPAITDPGDSGGGWMLPGRCTEPPKLVAVSTGRMSIGELSWSMATRIDVAPALKWLRGHLSPKTIYCSNDETPPQSPRHICWDSAGAPAWTTEPAALNAAMNPCNTHWHSHREHTGTHDGACLAAGEVITAQAGDVVPEACGAREGDMIEIHYAYTSCDTGVIESGAALKACVPRADCQVTVVARTVVLVSDPLLVANPDLGGLYHVDDEATPAQLCTGPRVRYAGSTTGPSYDNTSCSLQRADWCVKFDCEVMSITAFRNWCEDNKWGEHHGHHARAVVTSPGNLSRRTLEAEACVF